MDEFVLCRLEIRTHVEDDVWSHKVIEERREGASRTDALAAQIGNAISMLGLGPEHALQVCDQIRGRVQQLSD